MDTRHRFCAALLTCALVTFAASPALALKPLETPTHSKPQREVDLLENFSPLELTLTGIGAVGAVTLIGGGHSLFGEPTPSMGAPVPDSVDWRFTHWANPEPDPAGQFLRGVADLSGYVMPALAIGFYGLATVGDLLSDDFFLDGRKHELVAYVETISWTMVSVNALKLAVGRARPYAVRPDLIARRGEYKERESEDLISFPSGHSASAAATATFVAMDLSDYLVREYLADSHGAVKWIVGRGVPAIAAGGVTWTVMYSRIKDQRHWLSDTVTGAFIGAGFAALFYTLHFDSLGHPHIRHPGAGDEAGSTVRLNLSPFGPAGSNAGLSLGAIF